VQRLRRGEKQLRQRQLARRKTKRQSDAFCNGAGGSQRKPKRAKRPERWGISLSFFSFCETRAFGCDAPMGVDASCGEVERG
jgi:hypothetical protein